MKNKQSIGASPLWQNKQINKDSVAAVNAWNKMKSEYMNRTHKFKGRPNERPLTAEENLAEWNREKNEFYYDTQRNKLRLLPTDDGEIPIKGFRENLKPWQLAPERRSSEKSSSPVNFMGIKRPGRCTPFPNPDCEPGTPQYNLAKRLKPGGDLYKGKKK